MSRRIFRLMILLGTFALGPPRAEAQDVIGLPGDLLLLKTRELQLDHRRARLQEDIDRGDAAAVYRDLQEVRRYELKVETDRWMVRSDIFLPNVFATPPKAIPRVPPNPVLIPHPQFPGFGSLTADPGHLYRLPPAGSAPAVAAAPAAAGQVSIEIINAGRPGTIVDYGIDGVAHRIEAGRRQTLAIGPASTIAFDRGGGQGERRYSLSAGAYEFRPGDSGWDFFKLGTDPTTTAVPSPSAAPRPHPR